MRVRCIKQADALVERHQPARRNARIQLPASRTTEKKALHAGQVYDLPDEEAKRLQQEGIVEPVGGKARAEPDDKERSAKADDK